MNILVTGCMGFIGSNLIPFLLRDGHKVLGIDNLFKPSLLPSERMKHLSKEKWENFKFYNADINEPHNIYSILAANEKIDAVIHLAAIGSVPYSFMFPDQTMKTNSVGFTNMVNLVNRFDIKKFIFASSSSVYGDSSINPRVEGHEGKPLSPYALSKQDNEKLAILLLNRSVSFIGLRFFNVYGPGQSLNGHYSAVIPRFITEENPTIYGDGETKRDFTYVDDVCQAIFKSLFLTGSHILNVGSGVQKSLNELIKFLKKEDVVSYKDHRPGDVKESCADISAAKKILNYSPKVTLEDGLEITKNFYDTVYNDAKTESKSSIKN